MSALMKAARDGDLATIKRLYDSGVNLTERGVGGLTAIMVATMYGHTTTVKFLHAEGASITERNDLGSSALSLAAADGILPLVQYFVDEAGTSINEVTSDGRTLWSLLELTDADHGALASLLKIMVMLEDAPPTFVAKLFPAHAEIITRGRYFRAQLPSYLEQQRASVFEHCPLPPVLLPIVAEYVATAPEDMWTHGLRVEATDASGHE
jgi:hypothetical protein